MGKCKGKEYDDNLIYEGEYLNGQKNGYGKEYNYDGKLIFEGKYLNGKMWEGKRIEYDYKYNLIFESNMQREKEIEKNLI